VLFQTKLFKQPQAPATVELVEYRTVRQSRQIEAVLAVTAKIAYKELQMQEEPFVEGTWRESWQMQVPELVEAENIQVRAVGH